MNFRITLFLSAAALVGLAACNTTQDGSASTGTGSTTSATSEQNDTVDKGGAVSGSSGTATTASGGPGTPTPNRTTPPTTGPR